MLPGSCVVDVQEKWLRLWDEIGPRFVVSFCHTFPYSQPNKNSTTRNSATCRSEDNIEYLFVARIDNKKLSSDDVTTLY